MAVRVEIHDWIVNTTTRRRTAPGTLTSIVLRLYILGRWRFAAEADFLQDGCISSRRRSMLTTYHDLDV